MCSRLETVEKVVICLSAMSEDQRRLFIERHVDGKTLKILAEDRGVCHETIRTRLSNARSKALNTYRIIAVLDGIEL